MITHDMTIALIIFGTAYFLIASEKIPPTLAALGGGFMMILFGILKQSEGFQAVDLSVIFLLVGMMLMVEILSETGLFEFIAVKIAQIVKGNPILLLILMCISTAFLSAFLDNVTTVLLIAPVTIFIADQLQVDAIPYLLGETMASNIGGAATLIGDPPNILIGSAAKLSFSEFIVNLGPVVLVILLVFSLTFLLLFRKKLTVSKDLKAKIMSMEPSKALKDKKTMVTGLVIVGLVIGFFLTHHITHIEPATIAFVGAVLLLISVNKHPKHFFYKIEWNTLFFFIGLFILVEGVVKVGLISMTAKNILLVTENELSTTTLIVLWISGFLSSVIDNIPYVATLIPMIKEMIPQIADSSHLALPAVSYPLWWALSLGACLGGNGTLIGASANVVVASIAEKNKRKISFWAFTKYGILILTESLIISTVYIYWRYL